MRKTKSKMSNNLKPTKRKAFNFLRSYFDVLNQLDNDSDKLAFLTSIINKQFLDEDPKELSFIANLCYESQRHSIEKSVKGWITASNTDLLGNPILPLPLPNGSPNTPPKQEEQEQVQGEEQVKDKKENKKKDVFNFRKSLIDSGGEKKLVEDWLKVRKTKKATNTETAFEGFISEVLKSKQGINDILKICIERDWKGFKNSWLEKEINNDKNKNNEPTINRQTADTIRQNSQGW